MEPLISGVEADPSLSPSSWVRHETKGPVLACQPPSVTQGEQRWGGNAGPGGHPVDQGSSAPPQQLEEHKSEATQRLRLGAAADRVITLVYSV